MIYRLFVLNIKLLSPIDFYFFSGAAGAGVVGAGAASLAGSAAGAGAVCSAGAVGAGAAVSAGFVSSAFLPQEVAINIGDANNITAIKAIILFI